MSANVKEMSRTQTRRRLRVCAKHISHREDRVRVFWGFFLGIDATTQSYNKNSKKKSMKLEDVCVKGLDRSSTSGAVWQIITQPQTEFTGNTLVRIPFQNCSCFSHAWCKPRTLQEEGKGEGKKEMRSRADGKDLMSVGSLSAFI